MNGTRAYRKFLLETVEQLCRERMELWPDKSGVILQDDQYACNNRGTLTTDVTDKLGYDIPHMRRRLDNLVERGLLCKHSSPGRTNRYWPIGLAEKLKQGG